MPESYTPIEQFPLGDVSIWETGDALSKINLNNITKDLYNRIFFNYQTQVDNTIFFNNLETKLGISVANIGDVTLPTYSTPYLLTGNKSVKTALETLDSGLNSQNTVDININSNVGGNVKNSTKDNYSNNYFILNNDSHHVALGKLDLNLNSTVTTLTTTNTNLTTQTTRINNLKNNVGTNSDTGYISYSSLNFIVNGTSIQTIIEDFDRYINGSRRTADYAYKEWVVNWSKIESSVIDYFYDTFIDLSKRDLTNTTANIDIKNQECSGDTLKYYAIKTLPSSCTEASFRINYTGSITIEFNLISSFLDIDMQTVLNQDIFTSGLVSGSGLVIKITFNSPTAKIFNIAVLAR